MKPEESARQDIDKVLQDAGWAVQDRKRLNLGASLGVAVREFLLATGATDYLLFVDRLAVGVIEAKKVGYALTGVEEQSNKQTFGFFNQNLVMEYGHDRAVADSVNVDYQVYRIKTEISQQGSLIEAESFIGKRERRTCATR